jgi:hypothetical protein
MYYCKENNTTITWGENREVIIQTGDEITRTGTYTVYDWKLRLVTNIAGVEEEYEYQYFRIIDTEGNQYDRLKEYSVKFVTGKDSNTVAVNQSTGYKVSEPEKPTMAGNTFKCWCLGDGKEYNFDNIVTESFALYAKWIDGHGNEYLAVEADAKNEEPGTTPVIAIGICVLMVGITATGMVLILRKRKKEVDNHDAK